MAEHVETERPDWRSRGRWPDPTEPVPGTHWSRPAEDYAAPVGRSGWADAAEPGDVPAAVEPVTERVGWLTAGRTGAAGQGGAGGPEPGAAG